MLKSFIKKLAFSTIYFQLTFEELYKSSKASFVA
jgi:hypothetical protein